MELKGEVLVEAPRDRVWAALNDAAVLRRCIPGCEAMEVVSEHEKTATVGVKVGPVRARFQGRVRLEDIRAGEGCTLQFEGQGGAAGMARGAAQVTLGDEAGATRVRYQTQASVAGKLGQVGGRMIDAAARQMADQFFAAFQAEVAPARAPGSPAAGTPTPAVAGIDAEAQAAAAAVAQASLAPEVGGRAAPAPAVRPAAPASAAAGAGEFSRVLWFVLGSLSTGFGVWLGHALSR